MNIHDNEVMRAFKTVNDSYIEPVSFIVPRRAEGFQDDIFPPPVGSKPAMSAADWIDGKVALPPKINLANVYAGEEVKEVPSDFKPSPANVPEPAPPSPLKKTTEGVGDHAMISDVKGPPPPMSQQTHSIKDLAQKFNDTEEGGEDEASSFEEVSNLVDRSSPRTSIGAASPAERVESPAITANLNEPSSATKGEPNSLDEAARLAATQSTSTQILSQQEGLGSAKTEPIAEQLPRSDTAPKRDGADGVEVKQSLAEIKNLLEDQRRTMSAQNDTIGRLAAEVDRLRGKMDLP